MVPSNGITDERRDEVIPGIRVLFPWNIIFSSGTPTGNDFFALLKGTKLILITIMAVICGPFAESVLNSAYLFFKKQFNLNQFIFFFKLYLFQKLLKPKAGILNIPFKCLEVYVYQSKTWAVAFIPLKVIGRRPYKIAIYIYSFLFSF